MVDFWHSITGAAETLGGAALAPAGAVVDLAQMPFDDKDDDFGSIVHILSGHLAQTIDPVINPDSGLVGAISRAIEAANWAYKNGVDEPLSTATIASQQAFGHGRFDTALLHGAAFNPSNWLKLADPETWAKSYEIAQDQSFGQSQSFAMLDPNAKPFDYKNPYQDLTAKQHPHLGGGLALGTDIATMFALDPTAIALKGVGLARGVLQYGKLNVAQKANLLDVITAGSRPGLLRPNLASRTDKYLNWVGGRNSVGRPLSAQEIFHGTPELRRYAKDPEAVAGFLADANKITDHAERVNAQRRILAIAGGDVSQVARLRTEGTEAASLADQISNMAREGVIDLDALAVAPTLAQNPIFRLRLENQLGNLNKSGAVDKFLDDFLAYNDRLLETQKSLPNLPGVHFQGQRAVNRLNNQGLSRLPRNTLDNWSASLAEKAQSTSSVIQKGKYTVPLVAVRTVGLAASPWTRAPIAVSDALRKPAFTGMVPIHDWGTGVTQLDAMMDVGLVDPALRRSLMDEAFIATGESAKTTVATKVEHAAMQGLARWASKRAGFHIDGDYITELMQAGASKRNDFTTSLKGRIYAATQDPRRAQSMGRIEDATSLGQSRGFTAKEQGGWRLDQIDDHGTPLALPVFETELGNYIPLIDVDLAKRVLARNTGHLSNLSRAWKAESEGLRKLATAKAAGAQGLDRLIEGRAMAREALIDMGQRALHLWKFSVLFRLGYPMRVLTDDHLRINAKIGAAAFYGPNLKEYGGNKIKNFGRKAAARAEMHDLKVRKQEILDELDGNEMMVHTARRADVELLDKKIGSHQRSIAGLRKSVQDAEVKHSLGLPNDLAALKQKLIDRTGRLADHEAARDNALEQLGSYGPGDLKRELDDIEARIAGGTKSLRDPKRKVGMADVPLGDGNAVQGAFAGEFGDVYRTAAGSGGLYESLLQGAETRNYRAVSGGAHKTLGPDDDGHLDYWADALNHQIATSEVGKFFLEGGTVDEFTRWIKRPEQAALRRRVAHFAHDPEDWGYRAHGIVHDYVPNEGVRQALLDGRITPKQLREMVPKGQRPSVHGRAAADNLGSTHAQGVFGRSMNRMFRGLSETPTDVLSRHPFFNSMYRLHAKDFYAVRKAGGQTHFGQADFDEIAHLARRAALRDLKSTLFDLSTHSHAAEVMRFISPFFGAHQEGISRWWRIAADNPKVIRRLTQAMDVPRYAGLVVDENGDLVPPGAPLSSNHRYLLQLPEALGGPDPKVHQSGWTISEGAANIILQGGLTNPGTGPLVSVPMDYLANKYSDDEAIGRIARVFNPYPASNPLDNAFPATGKRMAAYIYGKTGHDPSLGLGIGKREYNDAYNRNLQDAMVGFQLDNGREPTKAERERLMAEVGADTTSQMFHRFLWNAASPLPASPRSKYAVIQQGWYKISEQGRAQGKDFDWAYAQFRAKYKDAYLPLVMSPNNNPAWVDANPADVAAIKHYRPLLWTLDPALQRMVIGPYADELIEKDKTLGDYNVYSANFLRDAAIQNGSDETYYNSDNPRDAVVEQQARRGWQKYNEFVAGLTAMAQQQGLDSYEDSPALVKLKQAGVAQIMGENDAFRNDYGNFNSEQYNEYLDGMKQIASAPVLANDPTRPDIQTLQAYLELHDMFATAMDQRQAAGLGGAEAAASVPLRQAYTALVDKLVESNTYFQDHMYNGLIERDPLLYREAS